MPDPTFTCELCSGTLFDPVYIPTKQGGIRTIESGMIRCRQCRLVYDPPPKLPESSGRGVGEVPGLGTYGGANK